MTSHDVVSRVRRALGQKRVGHAGTLDPAASGVLVLGLGHATRLLGLLTLEQKSYDVRIRFGSATDTDDADGKTVLEAPCDERIANSEFATVYLHSRRGTHLQLPPQFSAISKGGKRAYELAREGKEVELESREVSIYEAELLGIEKGEKPAWDCHFLVSKGCYIRSIARDAGNDLACGAHVETLRRTSSGSIELSDCVSLEQLERDALACVKAHALNPVEVLGYPQLELNESQLADVRCGRSLRNTTSYEQESLLSMLSPDGLIGIWQVDGRRLRTKVNFAEPIVGVRL
ncbi:MAG: tRNA pseudouridine(55) synthase TruB [Atopobiaceae bacterium]|nr:tRNA pseudouridine(55) synthase TruB [Atopobiaceae bacterium]